LPCCDLFEQAPAHDCRWSVPPLNNTKSTRGRPLRKSAKWRVTALSAA
jgi:hypothetical protein